MRWLTFVDWLYGGEREPLWMRLYRNRRARKALKRYVKRGK